jgi:deazaflavin-dependent oxidoreductase (nitroreductase family)
MVIPLFPKGTRGTEFPKSARWIVRAMRRLTTAAYSLLGSRMQLQGVPFLVLETIGAKTGKVRRALIPRFQDTRPGTWLVAASALGSATHPDWYLNLANDPDDVWVEIDRRRLKVRPEAITGRERDEAWRRIVVAAPRFGAYAEKTDRVIPIVRLTPTSEGPAEASEGAQA